MDSWYHPSLVGTERVLLSESGYTNDQLAMEWLDHFIFHTQSTPTSDVKLLLLDSHSSHRTLEFTIYAVEHNIITYAFPSHLTHILQPLDVGIFQPYKHWHREAVHSAIWNLDLEYNIRSFIRDLSTIREQTFKELTIIYAFKKAGVWPINYDNALAKLRKYSKPAPTLPSIIPASFQESEEQLQHWKVTLLVLLSSPSQQQYNNWVVGTEVVLAHGQLQELNVSILQRQVDGHKNRGRSSRRRLQIRGALTVEDARAQQAEKAERAAEKEASKEARIAR
jgi:hypothetical protein